MSTAALARLYPHLPVIGIDRSIARLARNLTLVASEEKVENAEKGQDVFHGTLRGAPNAILVRAELSDFWMLALRRSDWAVQKHYVLYPNPYPKSKHLQRRWHGHPVFPALLVLGGELVVRSNWQTYLLEMRTSLESIANATSATNSESGGESERCGSSNSDDSSRSSNANSDSRKSSRSSRISSSTISASSSSDSNSDSNNDSSRSKSSGSSNSSSSSSSSSSSDSDSNNDSSKSKSSSSIGTASTSSIITSSTSATSTGSIEAEAGGGESSDDSFTSNRSMAYRYNLPEETRRACVGAQHEPEKIQEPEQEKQGPMTIATTIDQTDLVLDQQSELDPIATVDQTQKLRVGEYKTDVETALTHFEKKYCAVGVPLFQLSVCLGKRSPEQRAAFLREAFDM
jgi:tRNA G46 methylase TrmB